MQRNRGNNRMEKTRDVFKKIRDTKGTFHAKIGSIKDRNGRDLEDVAHFRMCRPEAPTGALATVA